MMQAVESERGVLTSLARLGKNLAASLIGIAVTLLLLEGGLRLVNFSNDARVLVYPRIGNEINGFRNPDFSRDIPRGQFRILALGASAFVTREFQPRFQDLLDEAPIFTSSGFHARVISSGVPAHMTFDSLWKYEYWYRGYDLDLVIFYHGINDARANSYPDDLFQEDYTQLLYYRQYAPLFAWAAAHPRVSESFVVMLVRKLITWWRLRSDPLFAKGPYNDPRNDPWLVEGANVKTAMVFRRNLEAVLDIAKERGQRVLLLTYAYYLPDDYTNERFLEKKTDYSFMPESVATEVWGIKENVVAAIVAHNEVVREVASRHPEALFFDMERFMPKDRRHFIDICHWTDLGRKVFARGVLKALDEQGADLLERARARD
ncbi:MAG: hypothetical protein Q8R92_06095 [Deltaproteobacteria bacterium]|nr:hypothetical protein [Deltaproteobacteria bacterium]